MNPILQFYLNDDRIRDQLGFTHKNFINGTDEWLEDCHGHIQWAFPMEVPSMVLMQNTPILTPEVIESFKNSNDLRTKLSQSYTRMWNFYFNETVEFENDCFIYKTSLTQWITPRNHNFLRLTRMIRSLRMLGLPEAATHLYKKLCDIYADERYTSIIGPVTKNFWDNAYVESFD